MEKIISLIEKETSINEIVETINQNTYDINIYLHYSKDKPFLKHLSEIFIPRKNEVKASYDDTDKILVIKHIYEHEGEYLESRKYNIPISIINKIQCYIKEELPF